MSVPQSHDPRAVDTRVVHGAEATHLVVRLAEAGKPEAALGVEHDVVRAVERLAVAGIVERREAPGFQVDPLDRSAVIFGGWRARPMRLARQPPPTDPVV